MMVSGELVLFIMLAVVYTYIQGAPHSNPVHHKHKYHKSWKIVKSHLLGNETTNGQKRSLKSDKFKIACVAEHNSKRQVHKALPLIWSDRLSESAQEWANHLAEIDEEVKDPEQKQFGQNTFWIKPELPADAVCKAAVDEWYDEIKLYDFDSTHEKRDFNPDASDDFTQLIWDGLTREVGVGLATSKSHRQYIVAHYYKKGNIMGSYDREVHLPYTAKRASIHEDKKQQNRLNYDLADNKNQVYNVVINVTNNWNPLLKNRQSQQFKALKMKLKKGIEDVFYGPSPPLKTFLLNSFKPGKILADIDLGFRQDSKDPIQKLKFALNTGLLGGLPVASNFVRVLNKTGVFNPNDSNNSTSPCQPGNGTKPVFIAPGIQLVNQTTCPGGICQTLLIHPQPPPPPAPVSQYNTNPCSYPVSYSQPQIYSYPPDFSCTPDCPMNCCQMMMG